MIFCSPICATILTSGSTIGRVANRIRGARFQLNNRDYVLTRNEGSVSIHGGKQGFSRQVWDMEIEGERDNASVIFRLHSPNGDQGYPGVVDTTVRYRLNERNELIIEYLATCDRLTPISMTNHAYWNLRGDEHKLVHDHDLVLYGDFYLPNADDMIPTGEIVSVEDTPYDFRVRKRIGRDIGKLSNGYDCCWTLGSDLAERKHPLVDIPDGQRPVAFVRELNSRRTMEVFSTKPGVQFYTGNFLHDIPGRTGERLRKQTAFCLETQYYPNAINTPQFPSILLKRGKTYHHITTHRFGTIRS